MYSTNNNIRYIIFFILCFFCSNTLSSMITRDNTDWKIIKQWENLNDRYFFRPREKT